MSEDRETLWHLTENPDWKLDPTRHPTDAVGLPGPMRTPGLFVTNHPRYWEPWMGVGPIYVVQLLIPKESLPRVSEAHPEYFITDFENVEVVEVMPLEEAIERGQEEERRGVRDRIYWGFATVVDWWFACKGVWDDNKMETVQKCRTRKGLSRLMKKWRAEHPGFKDPDQYYRKKYGR